MLDISTKSAGAVGSSGANASSAKAKMIVISSFLQFLNLLLANNSQKFSSQTTSQDFEHSQKQFSVVGLDSDAFPIKVTIFWVNFALKVVRCSETVLSDCHRCTHSRKF